MSRNGKWRNSSGQRQSRHDQHEVTTRDQSDDSSWFQYEQDSVQVLFSKGISPDIKATVQFNEINGKEVQHVLTDLTLIGANGPECSYTNNSSLKIG